MRSLLSAILILALFFGTVHAVVTFNKNQAMYTSDGRIIVEFWHAMGAVHAGTLNEIIDNFNASQDKYHVQAINQGRYNSLSQKLIASTYAGRNPAISQMYPGWTTRFLQYGHLEPLQNFIDNDPEFTQEDIDDFFEGFIRENTMPLPYTGEEVLVTIPFNKSLYMLFVNQTALDEAGWEHEPRTWEELYMAARDMEQISEGGRVNRFGFAVRPYIEEFTNFLFSTGQNYLDANQEPIFDSEEGRKALEFIHRITYGENNAAYIEAGFLSTPFGDGRVGMFVGSTAGFPHSDRAVGTKFIWRAYPVPQLDPDAPRLTLNQGTNVGIFKNLPEEVKQGAWEFLKYFSSPEVSAYWALETGYVPIRRSSGELDFVMEELETNPNFAAAWNILDSATAEPRAIYWDTVRSVVSREVEAVLNNRRNPDESIEIMRREFERIRIQN